MATRRNITLVVGFILNFSADGFRTFNSVLFAKNSFSNKAQGKLVELEEDSTTNNCVALNKRLLLPPPPPGDPINFTKYAYVDKTDMLAKIMDTKGTFMFAPSMRRIGKSACIDMLAAMASGLKDMFNGYAVNNPDSSFKIGETIYSVIKLDFSGKIKSTIPLDTSEKVEAAIVAAERKFTEYLIEEAMDQHGITIQPSFDYDPGHALNRWLMALKEKEGRKIVLLIDEYDDPVTQFLPQHPGFAGSVADIIKPFYLTIKQKGSVFHKVFVTGVSKVSSTSLFSGANMFKPILEEDITFSNLYGFTEQEIRDTYGSFIEKKFNDRSLDEVMDDMRRMYDGYRIHPEQLDKDKFFNSWDVLNYFDCGKLDPHWAMSCTSFKVTEMLGIHGLKILDGFKIAKHRLFAPITVKEVPKHWQQLAFQTGYATIKHAIKDNECVLSMGVPNQEVRTYLKGEFVTYLVGQLDEKLIESYKTSLLALNFTKVEYFLQEIIMSLSLENVPSNEATFQAYVLFVLLNDERFRSVTAEVGENLPGDNVLGRSPRADGMVVFNKSGVAGGSSQLAVFEVKYNQNVFDAMKQMKKNDYAERAFNFYKDRSCNESRPSVHLVGINMNAEDNTVQLKHELWSQKKKKTRGLSTKRKPNLLKTSSGTNV